uniref:Uncharacterized protein n=1 Tax=Tanacetum cinerariifolium TaxID=118510 RepID=A0A6L2LSP2_TANCI|nr:hypothetical protein [Tanacetum cinerariifolium]
MMAQAQEEIGEGLKNPTDPQHTPIILQPSISQPQKTQKTRKAKRKDTQVPQLSGPTVSVTNEAFNEEMDDSLVRAATTASGLEAEQNNGNINKTQSKAIPNESSSQGTNLGGGPKCQETIGDIIAQTRSENVSKFSNDSLLAGVNMPRSDEDSMKLKELMELYTNLQNRVLDLETIKTTQAMEIDSLKRRVKKLENKQRSRTHKIKRLYKVGVTARVDSADEASLGEDASRQGRIIDDIDADEGITLVDETVENQGRFNDQEDAKMLFDFSDDLRGEEVFVSQEVPLKEVSAVDKVNVVSTATTTTAIIDDITLDKALMEIKRAKPKADKVVIQEPEQGIATTTLTTTAATTITASSTRTKAKGLVIHEQEQPPTSTKDQLILDEELAFKLQAKKEEKEANIALIESWDDVQAKLDADYQLAKRLQAIEQLDLNDKQKATLFIQLLEKRRNIFAAKRKMFDRAFKRVNTFVDFKTELVEESSKKAEAEIIEQESSKRPGTELEQESSKKQKIDDDKETAELKQLVKIIPDEERAVIDAIPLAIKPPSIVDWKIQKEGKKIYYKIIMADGSSKIYLVFSHMLKDFNKGDVEAL